MARRGIRIRKPSLFWRVALVVFLFRQFLLLGAVMKRVPPHARFWTFVFGKVGTQRSVYYALMAGVAISLLADLLTKLILDPLYRMWLTPRTDESAILFRVNPGEKVIHSTPARRQTERGWEAGSLAVTTTRLSFLAEGWDPDGWSLRHDDRADETLEPGGLGKWWIFEGVPERLVVRDRAGREAVFALAEPDELLDRLSDLDPAEPAGRTGGELFRGTRV